MLIPRSSSFVPAPDPRLAYTDYTPVGPWSDGQIVVRNYDGVGFTYHAALNTLSANPNLSASVKNANGFIIQNLPAPTAGGDVTNKTYVDSKTGGIPEAPTDGKIYGRGGSTPAWTATVPLAGGTMTGILTLSGVPSGTNDAANKGYVDTAISGVAVPPPSSTVPGMDGTGAAGSATAYSRGDHVHPSDTSKAPLASPAFTGIPVAPTAAALTNNTQLATTAYADSAVGVEKTRALAAEALLAPLASPIFTGTPAAPTPTAGTSTTQLATTQFVGTAIANAAVPAPSSTIPGMDGAGSAGAATTYSRGDHIHPSDTTKANLASPTFTGTPAAPTPTTADNTTTLATTAFVKAQGYAVGGPYLPLSGGTLTGALILAADPTATNGAATKNYVDTHAAGGASPIPTGTVMVFWQAAAPTGWTQVTTQNDKALRVVSGTGGVSGGTYAFSTVMAQTVVGNTTLSAAQMPQHTHDILMSVSDVTLGGAYPRYTAAASGYVVGYTGGSGSHNHSIMMAIQYIDIILASKN